jgi:2-hydroxychromene-2-carboxylate isomerase
VSIRGQAERVGLDWLRLQHDMGDPAIQARLQSNVGLARSLGIEGTPGFVVGQKLVVGSELTDLQGAVAAARAERVPAATNSAVAPATPGTARQ